MKRRPSLNRRKRKYMFNKKFVPNDHLKWRDQIQAAYVDKEKFTKRNAPRVTDLFVEEETSVWKTPRETDPFLEEEASVWKGPRETDPFLEEEASVWKKGLPDDVFCTILACLPLSSFCRLKCVCKKWSLMDRDPIFLKACAQLPSREPSLFVKERDGLHWIYEPAFDAWKRVPSSFLYPSVSGGACSLVTAAGGRLLFIRSSPSSSLMVFNPLNKSQRMLPPMIDMSEFCGLPSASEIHVVGMYVDTVKQYYKILVLDKKSNRAAEDDEDIDDDDFSDLEPIESQIYDSRTCKWEMNPSFDPIFELSIRNAAMYGEALHCLTISPQEDNDMYIHDKFIHENTVVEHLGIYKIWPDCWEYEIPQVPTQDNLLIAPHIFSTRGRQMVVAAVPSFWTRYNTYPIWKSIIIWELKEAEDKWQKLVEIDLTCVNPSQLRVTRDSFMFLGEGDLIYFGSNIGHSLGVINIGTKSWHLLSPFPGSVPSRPEHAERFQMFAYEPKFDLIV